ncbi:MAG TPA: hypothetical protein PLR26_07035 [Bacilli bacterium]|nr:hypothetical protein [Bacilli bacterium]
MNIVIIDNEYKEIKPLADYFEKNGHHPTIITKKSQIPKIMNCPIDILFLDLVLVTSPFNESNLISMLLPYFNEISNFLHPDRDYILIIWSTDPTKANSVISALKENKFAPISKNNIKVESKYTYMSHNSDDNSWTISNPSQFNSIMDHCYTIANARSFFNLWSKFTKDALVYLIEKLTIEFTSQSNSQLVDLIANLSYLQLEDKRFAETDCKFKAMSAVEILNEFLFYNIEDKFNTYLSGVNESDLPIIPNKINSNENLGKLNKWRYIKPSPIQTGMYKPGVVFTDNYASFLDYFLGKNEDNPKFPIQVENLQNALEIQCAFIEVSSACDYAQKKNHVHKVLPVIILPKDKETEFVKAIGYTSTKALPENFECFRDIVCMNNKEYLLYANYMLAKYIKPSDTKGCEVIMVCRDWFTNYIRSKLSSQYVKIGLI